MTIDKQIQKNNPLEEVFTVTEVANILRCGPITVRRWITNGALDAVTRTHLNKRKGYRVKKSVLDALLGEQEAAK